MRIEIISGSPRLNSLSRRVAIFLQHYFKETTAHEIGLIDMKDWDLPQLDSVFTSVIRLRLMERIKQENICNMLLYSVSPEIQWQLLSCPEKSAGSFSKTASQTIWHCVLASPGSNGRNTCFPTIAIARKRICSALHFLIYLLCHRWIKNSIAMAS